MPESGTNVYIAAVLYIYACAAPAAVHLCLCSPWVADPATIVDVGSCHSDLCLIWDVGEQWDMPFGFGVLPLPSPLLFHLMNIFHFLANQHD